MITSLIEKYHVDILVLGDIQLRRGPTLNIWYQCKDINMPWAKRE